MRGHFPHKFSDDWNPALNYVEHMASLARQKLRALYSGISALHFVDFPDYPNVGDSAIALGNLEFWASASVEVKDIHSLTTIPWRAARTWSSPIVINGGGNLGGLYPPISHHRYKLAVVRDPRTLLIQAPQSVHFTSDVERSKFSTLFRDDTNTRIAVRDRPSLEATKQYRKDVLLAPDSAHVLGHIPAPGPESAVIRLLRRDSESATSFSPMAPTVDWGRDPRSFEIMTWIRWRMWRFVPSMQWVTNHSTSTWIRKAEMRLATGVRLLSAGEVLITDRLHAMILALQMGRPVVAVDNNNCKLSSYAEAWFESAQPNLRFASTAAEAERVARTMAG